MSFSPMDRDNRRLVYLSLANSIESQLRDAYAIRHEAGLDNQVTIADKLGVGRSVVNKRLSGRTNMTIESIADLVWAMGQCIKVDIFDPYSTSSNEYRIISEHASPPPSGKLIESGTSTNKFENTFEHV